MNSAFSSGVRWCGAARMDFGGMSAYVACIDPRRVTL
jgi:hypothetical protein